MDCITCGTEKDEKSTYDGVCMDCYNYYDYKFRNKYKKRKIGKKKLHHLIEIEIRDQKIDYILS